MPSSAAVEKLGFPSSKSVQWQSAGEKVGDVFNVNRRLTMLGARDDL
jgi:hypothetical protein